MRIALCGSSSTGKTALANELMNIPTINDILKRRLNVDARLLLRSMGFMNMDEMTEEETRLFQCAYYFKKKLLECNAEDFLTERSFVDIAAFWLIRDARSCSCNLHKWFADLCFSEAVKYDMHIFIPFGLIPFQPDGYRSTDLKVHKLISSQIETLLISWNINYIKITTADLSERIKVAVSSIASLINIL